MELTMTRWITVSLCPASLEVASSDLRRQIQNRMFKLYNINKTMVWIWARLLRHILWVKIKIIRDHPTKVLRLNPWLQRWTSQINSGCSLFPGKLRLIRCYPTVRARLRNSQLKRRQSSWPIVGIRLKRKAVLETPLMKRKKWAQIRVLRKVHQKHTKTRRRRKAFLQRCAKDSASWRLRKRALVIRYRVRISMNMVRYKLKKWWALTNETIQRVPLLKRTMRSRTQAVLEGLRRYWQILKKRSPYTRSKRRPCSRRAHFHTGWQKVMRRWKLGLIPPISPKKATRPRRMITIRSRKTRFEHTWRLRSKDSMMIIEEVLS